MHGLPSVKNIQKRSKRTFAPIWVYKSRLLNRELIQAFTLGLPKLIPVQLLRKLWLCIVKSAIAHWRRPKTSKISSGSLTFGFLRKLSRTSGSKYEWNSIGYKTDKTIARIYLTMLYLESKFSDWNSMTEAVEGLQKQVPETGVICAWGDQVTKALMLHAHRNIRL